MVTRSGEGEKGKREKEEEEEKDNDDMMDTARYDVVTGLIRY